MLWRLALSVLLLPSLSAATRKAVLIGIDVYKPKSAQRLELQKIPIAHTFPRPPVPDGWEKIDFENLRGAVADAELMKSILSAMNFDAFVTLYNQNATADAILSTLRRELIDDAASGDIRFVYYSGHGNIARNRATHGQDETIVPADHWRGVPDIRDKEISRVLYAAGRKGVIVTFVADSCHSGSLTRGSWNPTAQPKTTTQPFIPIEVDDPPDIDKATGQPIDPKDVGVLSFSAAQRNEQALEYATEEGRHGAFTWALRQALLHGPGQAALVYQRTLAFLAAETVPQQPVMEASDERRTGSLTGDPADPTEGLIVTADSINGRTLLRAGPAIGVYEGCEFEKLGPAQTPVRIRVLKTVSPAVSEASTISPLDASISSGDQFRLVRYVVPPRATLRVFIPKSDLRPALVQQLARSPAIEVRASLEGAQYALTSRFDEGRLQYAWSLPGAAEDAMSPMPTRSDWTANPATLLQAALTLGRIHSWLTLPAPPNALAASFPYHLAIAGAATGQLLPGHELKGGSRYRVILRARASDLQKIGYHVAPRFIYVFSIDRFGKGCLVFPMRGHGNEGNRLPAGPDARDQSQPVDVHAAIASGWHLLPVSPPEAEYDFEVAPPYGVDTYFLLATAQPITDTEVFNFDGVRTRDARPADPLTRLLSNIGSKTRGDPLPADWSFEYQSFRSSP